jgi:hypothetical protein
MPAGCRRAKVITGPLADIGHGGRWMLTVGWHDRVGHGWLGHGPRLSAAQPRRVKPSRGRGIQGRGVT